MIIVMKNDAPKDQVAQVIDWLSRYPVEATAIYGQDTAVIGVVGDTSVLVEEQILMRGGVERVVRVSEPYKRANRKFHPDSSLIKVGDTVFGGTEIPVIAGPCSVEGEDQIADIAAAVKAGGATLLRGGAFKPRTSPYAFQGLKAEGLIYMKTASTATGLPIVTEITNISQIELFEQFVDMYQVGARNMQNFELLRALGHSEKPVLLKRGFSNTIEELLMSAEYIMSGGNSNVILCERGIRTFETATRNTLDVSAVPVLKRLSHLPVIIDPSHAAGEAWLVPALSKAAVAVGADGLIIEVHNDPPNALSDGAQSLTPDAFSRLMQDLSKVASAVGRSITLNAQE